MKIIALLLPLPLLLVVSAVAARAAEPPSKPLRALLITGGCCHDYGAQKKTLTEGISARAPVEWTVVHDPRTGTTGKIELHERDDWAAGFDVVVHNECFSDEREPAWVERILKPHREGVPAVLIHCAMHSYQLESGEWDRFCGVKTRDHGSHFAYEMKNLRPEHPIMRGLPPAWRTPKEELYNILAVLPTATPLAAGFSPETGRDEVNVWINQYGRARVFGTTIGHYNHTLREPWFLDLVTRGLLWAAGRDAALAAPAHPGIPRATNSPPALPPEASRATFQLPPGFRAELVASEPLIHEPSAVCWDERGRLFVTQLHGYNVDGWHDIQELNKTGQLDTAVRRVRGTPEAKKRAEAETYGVLKLLRDRDGDGRMDDAVVWANDLPPIYGVVPARGGLILACAPDIVFLADTDGDDRPDVRETLFTGFKTGELERGINAPHWGPDGWIYFGAGWGGSRVTGPKLKDAVELGHTDFRIRPDGSALEPVEGESGTVGHAFTLGGDRFFTDTSRPSRYAVPLPWRYLARNPDAAMPRLIEEAHDSIDTFPIAPAHPWRLARGSDPAWEKFYGREETKPQGYFTSACSPLIYDDVNWPAEFRGRLFVCDPAQSLVACLQIEDDGPGYRTRRPAGFERREFLAAADSWFRPIYLAHAPDGSVWVVDMYREFIEDFSAIPRYLQQQYDLLAGRDKGRLWRLTHEQAPKAPAPDMSRLDAAQLARETASPHAWRRDTARRLLMERRADSAAVAASEIRRVAFGDEAGANPAAVINALYTLDGLGALESADLLAGWRHPSPDVRRHVLRLADTRWAGIGRELEAALLAHPMPANGTPRLALQIAASLGESRHPAALPALASLARAQGEIRWMDAAILSSVPRRELDLFRLLAPQPGQGVRLLEPLVAAIAARGDTNEIAAARVEVARAPESADRAAWLRLLDAGLADVSTLEPAELLPPPEPPQEDFLAEVEKALPRFAAALDGPRDVARGRALFAVHCAACHQAKGLGALVGPNLDSERQRAEPTILRDILLPSETIRPGFETYVVQTRKGESVPGILAAESPTSVTVRLPGGDEFTLLRKRVRRTQAVKVSLMPASYAQTLEPSEAADLIAFLRAP